MTRSELLHQIERDNPDLYAVLADLTESEWSNPDLCIVGNEPDGTVSYFWPSRVVNAA